MRKELIWLLWAVPCLGSDVAVLVDVSGSMAHYGAWQVPAQDLIGSILTGTPAETGWMRQGDSQAIAEFSLGESGKAQVVRFGSAKRTFPYFAPPQAVLPPDLGRVFPTEFSEPKTNKSLAMAVGSQLVVAPDRLARLIAVSDFLIDADLTFDQQKFVHDFESRARIEYPVIYTWQGSPHVVVKLVRVTLSNGPPPPVSNGPFPPGPTVTITTNRVVDSPRRAVFAWRLSPPDSEATYSISVVNRNTKSTVFARDEMPSTSTVWNNPPAGDFAVRVTANLPGGAKASSTAVPLSVPGASAGPTIAAIVIVIAAGFGLRWYARRRSALLHRAETPEAGENAKWRS